jgi:hypothetical protein
VSALQGGGRWFDQSYAHPNPVTGKDTKSAYRPQHATEAHRRVWRKPGGGSGRRRGSGEDEPRLEPGCVYGSAQPTAYWWAFFSSSSAYAWESNASRAVRRAFSTAQLARSMASDASAAVRLASTAAASKLS